MKILVDAFGIIFRSYYAFINRPLRNKNGENVSAVFGFFRGLLSTVKAHRPDEMIIALEGRGPCFRKEIYPEYKAHRPEAPDDLKEQITKIIDLIEKLDIVHMYKDNFEADDIIGSLAKHYESIDNNTIIIYSSDKICDN